MYKCLFILRDSGGSSSLEPSNGGKQGWTMFIDNQSWCLLQSPVGDSRCLYSCCLRPSEGGGAFGFPNGPRELNLCMFRFGFKRTPVSPGPQTWRGERVDEVPIFSCFFKSPIESLRCTYSCWVCPCDSAGAFGFSIGPRDLFSRCRNPIDLRVIRV